MSAPLRFCACGCGMVTPLATMTNRYVRPGQPQMYVNATHCRRVTMRRLTAKRAWLADGPMTRAEALRVLGRA